jgi:hypothetical protein
VRGFHWCERAFDVAPVAVVADSVTRHPTLVGNQDSVSGTVQVPAPPAGKTARVTVRVLDGARPLDQQTLAIGSDPVDVHWSVAAEPLLIELTAASVPTLYGHVVRPVPRCPNPDEGLSWG